MKRNEKILLGSLLGAFVVLMTYQSIGSAVFGPFQTRSDDLANLQESVKKNGDELLKLARARGSLKALKLISLPPDPGKSKQPTALNAQRQYVQWLTDLGQLCGFEYLKVAPGGTVLKDKVYISVVGKLEGEARYEQLVWFLDLFYRTNLLHRITSLNVTTKVFEGDPTFKVTIDAEGLALVDAPSRRTLFPQTALAEQINDDGKSLRVADLEEFPKEPGFRIQIKNEFLKVTAMDGKMWIVERAIERTNPAAYPEGTIIELVRMNPKQSERTLDEFREMIATNIFVKPAPPYKLKLGPLSEKIFTRGRSNDFTIAVTGYDTLKGKPEFVIVGSPPPGLKLDKSGKVSWRPGNDVDVGKYPVKFEVRHPSAPHGVLTETVTIRLRDSTSVRLVAAKPPRVYLNRDWTFLPELAASDSPSVKLTWKLGEKSPPGLTINEKNGELKWTPGDAVEIGETTVSLIVSDSDSPPQSTTLTLKLDVQDDAAQFTRLTGILAIGDKRRVFLTDQSTAKKTELHEGDAFAISDLSGKIKRIGGKYLIMTLGEQDVRWDVGQSLREAQATIKDY